MTAHPLEAGQAYLIKSRDRSPQIIEVHHAPGQIDHVLLPFDAFGRFGWLALSHDAVIHGDGLKVTPRPWYLPEPDAVQIRNRPRFAAPLRFGGCIYARQKPRKGASRTSLHDNRGLDLGSEAIATLLSSQMIGDALPPLPDGPDYAQTLRVAVVLHLHYPELWEEFATVLEHSKLTCRLIVTLTAPNPTLEAAIQARFEGAKVQIVDNLGRDIRPFMEVLHSGALDDVDLICKLHGKRSVLSGVSGSRFGHLWRRRNLLDLLGSPNQVAGILAQFEARPKLGMMGSAPLRLRNGNGPEPGYVASLPARRDLCEAAEIDPRHIADDLFAGTMFWVRRSALEPLRHLFIGDRYTPEDSQTGDQFEHALERFFADCVRARGMVLGDIAPLTLSSGPLGDIVAPRALWAGPNAGFESHWAKPLPDNLEGKRIALLTAPDAPTRMALSDAGYLTVLCSAQTPPPDLPCDAIFIRTPQGSDMTLWGAALRAAPALWDAEELLLVSDRAKDLPLKVLQETTADCVSRSLEDPLALLSLRPPALADPEVRAFFTTALNWTTEREARFRYDARLIPLLTETCGLQMHTLGKAPFPSTGHGTGQYRQP